MQLNRHVGGRGMQALSLIAFLLLRNRLLQLTVQLRKVRNDLFDTRHNITFYEARSINFFSRLVYYSGAWYVRVSLVCISDRMP